MKKLLIPFAFVLAMVFLWMPEPKTAQPADLPEPDVFVKESSPSPEEPMIQDKHAQVSVQKPPSVDKEHAKKVQPSSPDKSSIRGSIPYTSIYSKPKLAALESGEVFTLQLTPDLAVQAQVRSNEATSHDSSNRTLVSTMPGVPFGRVITTIRDSDVYTYVAGAAVGDYEIIPDGTDTFQVTHYDYATLPDCEVSHDMELAYTPDEEVSSVDADEVSDADGMAQDTDQDATSDTSIYYNDVIILFNDQARVTLGGAVGVPSDDTDIKLKIAAAVAAANTTYEDSGVPLKLRLLYCAQVDYAYPTGEGFSRALSELANLDGNVDEALTLRETYSADFVCLWVESNVTGGLAYVISNSFNDSAFSIVRAKNPLSTFVHELGHNQGCRHLESSYGSTPNSWFSDSFAHFFTTASNSYVTVMASTGNTSSTGADARILRLSDPSATYEGGVLGVTNEANCVRTFKSNRDYFASLKTYQPGEPTLTYGSPNMLSLEEAFPSRTYALYRTTDFSTWTATGDTVSSDASGAVNTPAQDAFAADAIFYRFELQPQ